jgi:hypothetical protein
MIKAPPIPSIDLSTLKEYQTAAQQAGGGHLYELWHHALNRLTPDLAIAVTKLFLPEFVRIYDCVFHCSGLTIRSLEYYYHHWRSHFGSNRSAIERVLNFTNFRNLAPFFDELSQMNQLYFLSCIAETWDYRLHKLFYPETFVVEIFQDDEEECEGDWVLTFYHRSE